MNPSGMLNLNWSVVGRQRPFRVLRFQSPPLGGGSFIEISVFLLRSSQVRSIGRSPHTGAPLLHIRTRLQQKYYTRR